jgi:hypothetical protein
VAPWAKTPTEEADTATNATIEAIKRFRIFNLLDPASPGHSAGSRVN